MPKRKKLHPHERANFISRVLLWWIFPLLRKGFSSPLMHDDLYSVREEERAEYQTNRLKKVWEEEKSKARQKRKKAMLWKALSSFFSWQDYGFIAFLSVLNIISLNLTWFSIVKLVNLFGNKVLDSAVGEDVFVCICGMVMGQLLTALSVNHFYLFGTILGIRTKAATTGLIYNKLLGLSTNSIDSGRVMELVNDDCQRLAINAEWSIQDGVRMFLRGTCSIGWLLYFVGWQPLLASTIFLLLGCYRLSIAKVDYKLRRNASCLAEMRLGSIREVLIGITGIKLNAMEDFFANKIGKIRRKEVVCKTKRWVLMGVSFSIFSFGLQLGTLVSILLLLTDNEQLTFQKLFAIMIYMGQLNLIFARSLPVTIQVVTDVFASLTRIQEFLGNHQSLLEMDRELNKEKFTKQNSSEIFVDSVNTEVEQLANQFKSSTQSKRHVHMLNVDCKLPFASLPPFQANRRQETLLQNINVDIEDRGLIIITGPVGSGKSTLLDCILGGEFFISSGFVSYLGKLAYVPETPWVFPGTVRENILFGQAYNENQYQKTIEACQLEEDLKQFPQGDLTYIGEHSSTVSGGQRTRIALARAVYSQADILLLDGPLNSLDVKVADNVFKYCLKGLLADRIVFLTTSRSCYLKDADHIVKMDRGEITIQGCYEFVKNHCNPSDLGDDRNNTVSGLVEEKLLSPREPEHSRDNDYVEIMKEAPEDREIGHVSYKVYVSYFTSGVPILVLLLVATIYCVGKGLIVVVDLQPALISELPKREQTSNKVLGNYSVLLAIALLFLVAGTLGIFGILMKATYTVHNKMVDCILKAPSSFHAENPVGGIMNRFSQDINNLDELLPKYFVLACHEFPMIIAAFILASIANPFLIPFVVVTILVVIFTARFYLGSSQDIKRLVSIAGGPLCSHFSNTIEGLKTIRAHKKEKTFTEEVYRHIDGHSQALFAYYVSVRWLANTLDMVAVVFSGVVSLFLVYATRNYLSAAVAVTTIFYASNLVERIQYTVRTLVENQSLMTSAERTLSYTKIQNEKGWNISKRPPKDWPYHGSIQFLDISLSHYENGPKALRNITFYIQPLEKIGIVGRTGAGKSSLVAALMCLSESQGEITIDGINIKNIHVQSARRSISVIPQSPTLFNGSLRANLDPFNKFKDNEIWAALDRMQMKSVISSSPGQLESEVTGRGSNFSVGQRQLLNLTRVLLMKTKIIVLDEATANVDHGTDETIQQVIRSEFKACTVITIAHRLNTILDSDRIMFLDHGGVREFDKPDVLLDKEYGFFKQLYEASTQG